jgi:lysophospholipase L1-like esterase
VATAIAQPTGFPYYDLVLQGQGTMLRQCIAQNPTFITIELGSSEALRPVLKGGDPAAIIPAAVFSALYAQLMDSLAAGAPGALLALANVPDVTGLPYATTIPVVINAPVGPGGSIVPVRLRDSTGPLPDGSLILLPANALVQSGYGFPSPAPPLPDSVVITLAERSAIQSTIAGYNSAIATYATAHGAALVDEFSLYDRLYREGVLIGGVHYSTAFVAGGLFSLDGLHPSTLGSGVLANEFIASINTHYGARISPVNLAELAGTSPASLLTAERR